MTRRDFIWRAPLAAGATLVWARSTAAPALGLHLKLAAPETIFPHATFHNVDHLEPAMGEGWRLNRVPRAIWEKLNRAAQARAYSAAGAEVRFNLVGSEARLIARFVEDRSGKARGWPVLAEIRQGDFLMRCVELRDTWTAIEIKQPANQAKLAANGARQGRGFDPNLVRIALPYMPVTELLRIEGEIATPRNEQLPARRFLAYGSSITHGAYALRAAETYPARVAHALGVDHLNLGFSAGAHLEPEIAEWIVRRNDWDFATLELGVNLLTPLSTAEFRSRLEVFMKIIATAPAAKWIFVIDIFTAGQDFEANPKRDEFRNAVREIVHRLGRPKIRHLDGRKLLTRTTGLSADLLHPSAEGFDEIGQRLSAAIREAMASELPTD